ncbi:hypothetical protein [Flavobacterium tegetincola]|uniref:hypothetical protein n=1 Tax=Flavobacterium tegetincola TaxID=150172 RepID=UPI00040FEC4E|nr:hypothetical protein [Flavobacterium tegetincola]
MLFQKKYSNDFESENIEYINLIINKVHDSIILASKKDSDEIFFELLLFLRDELLYQSLNKSFSIYSKVIQYPASIYLKIPLENKKKLIEVITIRFSESIKFHNYTENIDKRYLELTYFGLISLVKATIDERNSQSFNLVFKKLKETYLTFDDKNDYYNFAFPFAILSWLFYLHQYEKIKLGDFDINVLESIFINSYYNREELINSYYKFKYDVDEGLWEIGNWQIEKPPVGEAYFMLMASTWLNFGFTVMLLKYKILNYGFEIQKITIRDSFRFEFDNVKENLEIIEKDKVKWFPFLYNQTPDNLNIDDFNYSKAKIIEFFSVIQKEQEILKYKEISNIPLSVNRIAEFKKDVGAIWDSNSVVPKLLKHFERVTYAKNIIEKLGIGIFTKMLKSRFAFIDGDKYQNIIGLTDFGNKTARNVNREFFKSLMNKKYSVAVKGSQLSQAVDRYLNSVNDKTKIVIFCNYKNLDLLNDSQNKVEYVTQSEIPFSRSQYREIPIINNYESEDFLFIVDLNSINYIIYQQDEWYNKELLVEITEPIKDGETSTTDYENDEVEYSSEEVDVLEGNAVNVKILFKHDMVILDPTKYIIYKIIT